jgi:hypothetical protein
VKPLFFLIICSSLSTHLFAANSRISDDEYKPDGTVYNRFNGETSPEKVVTACIIKNCEKNISLVSLPLFDTKAFSAEAEKVKKYNLCRTSCGSKAKPVQIEKLISLENIIKDCELTLMTFQKEYYHEEMARQDRLTRERKERNGYNPNVTSDDLLLVQKDTKAALCEDVRGGIKNLDMLSILQRRLDACVQRYKISPASVDKLFLTNVQLAIENLNKIKHVDNSVLRSLHNLHSSCLGLTHVPSSYEIKSSSRFHNPKVFEKFSDKPFHPKTEGR